jgi:hypothetical protein
MAFQINKIIMFIRRIIGKALSWKLSKILNKKLGRKDEEQKEDNNSERPGATSAQLATTSWSRARHPFKYISQARRPLITASELEMGNGESATEFKDDKDNRIRKRR